MTIFSLLCKGKSPKTSQRAFFFFYWGVFINRHIIEFLISDILTASLISAVFLGISQKISNSKSREQEKHLQEIKDHIDQKIHQAVLEVENDIITNIDRVLNKGV